MSYFALTLMEELKVHFSYRFSSVEEVVGVDHKENRLLARQMKLLQCFQLKRSSIKHRTNCFQMVRGFQGRSGAWDSFLGHSNVLTLNSGSFTVPYTLAGNSINVIILQPI